MDSRTESKIRNESGARVPESRASTDGRAAASSNERCGTGADNGDSFVVIDVTDLCYNTTAENGNRRSGNLSIRRRPEIADDRRLRRKMQGH